GYNLRSAPSGYCSVFTLLSVSSAGRSPFVGRQIREDGRQLGDLFAWKVDLRAMRVTADGFDLTALGWQRNAVPVMYSFDGSCSAG
ncbi:MAG: hypothetical protein ACRDQ0_16410, partial [Pseudonocardia sp.]